jgi:hypothetical protein
VRKTPIDVINRCLNLVARYIRFYIEMIWDNNDKYDQQLIDCLALKLDKMVNSVGVFAD